MHFSFHSYFWQTSELLILLLHYILYVDFLQFMCERFGR